MIESWNPGAERLFGYSASAVIGRSVAMLFPPESTDEAFDVLERVYRGETVASFESERGSQRPAAHPGVSDSFSGQGHRWARFGRMRVTALRAMACGTVK